MLVGEKIIVYGTLRPQGRAFHLIDGSAKHLGEAVVQAANLYDIGPFPGVKLSDSFNDRIIGDVFEITDRSLPPRLDQYEGYPNLYNRQLVKTSLGDAWIYTYNGDVKGMPLVKSGDWFKKEEAA